MPHAPLSSRLPFLSFLASDRILLCWDHTASDAWVLNSCQQLNDPFLISVSFSWPFSGTVFMSLPCLEVNIVSRKITTSITGLYCQGPEGTQDP